MAQTGNMLVYLGFIFISSSYVIAATATTHLRGSNSVAITNTNFTLTCDVTSGTLPAVVFQKENSIIGSVTYINGECKNRDTEEPCTPEMCSCDGSSSYSWTLDSVPETWHNSTFTCDSVFGGSSSNVYKIYVSVPVTRVDISPNVANVDIIARKLSSFSCQTQPASRPRATLSWYKKYPGGLDTEVIDAISTQHISTGDLAITNSTLVYNPLPGDNGISLYCSAKTKYMHPVLSNSVQLNILYKPHSVPLVSSGPKGPYFMLNSTVHLTCELTGGNPVANLSWSCDRYNTGVTSMDTSKNNTAILILPLFINSSSLEGERCICTATHYIDDYRNSAEFILKLKQFPVPSFSVISTSTIDHRDQQKADEHNFTFVIVGCGIGGVVAILIVVFICIYITKLKRRQDMPPFPNAIDLSGNSDYDYIDHHQRTCENDYGKGDPSAVKSCYLTPLSYNEEQNNEQQARNKRMDEKVASDVNTNKQESEAEAKTERRYEKLSFFKETKSTTETERQNEEIVETDMLDQGDDIQVQDRDENDGYLEPTPRLPSAKSERKDISRD